MGGRRTYGLVLVLFAVGTARNDPQAFVAMIVIAALAVLLDLVRKRTRPSTAPASVGI